MISKSYISKYTNWEGIWKTGASGKKLNNYPAFATQHIITVKISPLGLNPVIISD